LGKSKQMRSRRVSPEEAAAHKGDRITFEYETPERTFTSDETLDLFERGMRAGRIVAASAPDSLRDGSDEFIAAMVEKDAELDVFSRTHRGTLRVAARRFPNRIEVDAVREICRARASLERGECGMERVFEAVARADRREKEADMS